MAHMFFFCLIAITIERGGSKEQPLLVSYSVCSSTEKLHSFSIQPSIFWNTTFLQVNF
jgi:hypothetical protein